MTFMDDARMSESLDRWITGNYGEDDNREPDLEDDFDPRDDESDLEDYFDPRDDEPLDFGKDEDD